MRDTEITYETPAPCSNLIAAAIRNGVDYADVADFAHAARERRAESILEAVIASDSVFVARLYWHGELA